MRAAETEQFKGKTGLAYRLLDLIVAAPPGSYCNNYLGRVAWPKMRNYTPIIDLLYSLGQCIKSEAKIVGWKSAHVFK